MLEAPLWIQPATGDPAINYSAQQDRTLFDALLTSAGIMTEGALTVSQRAAGANFSVDVSPGWCAINGSSIAYQGKYMCRSTAVENVTLSAPPGTGSRTDSVYARVYDNQSDGSGQYLWALESITGTVLPANSLLLATVTRTAGEASVVNSVIHEGRALARAFNSDQVTTVNAIPGFGTYNPAKIRKRLTGFAEATTDSQGLVSFALPAGTTAVLGFSFTLAYRTFGQAIGSTATIRLDLSSLTTLKTQWRDAPSGTAYNAKAIAYTYDLQYQQ